ncbi:MAG TPA: hypothetical protein VF813_08650 [Anaerolineaceae bacterium]
MPPKPTRPGGDNIPAGDNIPSWDITGNEWAARLLAHHAASGEPAHAYLLAGPPGIGRRTLALRFAQELNCPQPVAPGQPCRTCRTCVQIERMQHPDLFVVERAPDKTELLIDQVRTLQHNLSLRPYEGRYRIGLILRFQEANLNAANALLKTLEEAPSQAVLLLTADTPESLLPTIVSRCEVLLLRPMTPERTAGQLEEREGISHERALLLGHLSGGRYGYALRLENEPRLLEQRGEWLDSLHELLGSSRRERFIYADRISRDKDLFRQALQIWLAYWRDALLITANAAAPLVNLDREPELRALSGRIDLATSRRLIHETQKALRQLDANAIPRLVAEVLVLGWPAVP